MSQLIDLKARILLTLAYTDQFKYPLSSSEIWQRLPGGKKFLNYSQIQFVSALVSLFREKKIVFNRGFWSLYGSRASASIRHERKKYAEQKMQEIGSIIKLLAWTPWIKGVAITGSVSMNNATRNDDIDFMVVTAPNRLWLVRPLIIFFAWLKGKRRSWQKEEKNSWCFNLWLDNDYLAMPKQNRNIYSAYEVCQARWVFSKDGVAQQFYRQNKWRKHFLPNFPSFINYDCYIMYDVVNPLNIVVDLLNKVSYRLQLWYMKPHRTVEKVGIGYAFFHPRDTYSQIIDGWKKRI